MAARTRQSRGASHRIAIAIYRRIRSSASCAAASSAWGLPAARLCPPPPPPPPHLSSLLSSSFLRVLRLFPVELRCAALRSSPSLQSFSLPLHLSYSSRHASRLVSCRSKEEGGPRRAYSGDAASRASACASSRVDRGIPRRAVAARRRDASSRIAEPRSLPALGSARLDGRLADASPSSARVRATHTTLRRRSREFSRTDRAATRRDRTHALNRSQVEGRGSGATGLPPAVSCVS